MIDVKNLRDALVQVNRHFVVSKEELTEILDRLEAAVAERDTAWEELRGIRKSIDANPEESTLDEANRVMAKRNALAAHVERVRAIRKQIDERYEYLGQHIVSRSVAQEERYAREIEVLKDALDEALDDAPATSLARLKAQHIEAALRHAEALLDAGATADEAFDTIRRQAEEGAS